MSKELIEKLREKADSLTTTVGVMNLLHEAADALEAKAAPVGDVRGHDTKGSRKALGAMNAKLKAKIGRLERELASYQREQQPQSAEAFQKPSVLKDCNVRYSTSTTPQPSAGVVMPERKQLPDLMLAEFHEFRGWNACLDEFARLNGKEVGRG